MKDRVHTVGEWLGTTSGFWFNMVVAAVSVPIAFYSITVSTLVLSIAAIVLPAFILKRDHDRDMVSAKRDEAMHAKLDELIRAIPAASNTMARIEESIGD